MLYGAAYNSRLSRFWRVVSNAFLGQYTRDWQIDYITNSIFAAIAWYNFMRKEDLIASAQLYVQAIKELFPEDDILDDVFNYIKERGWEKPGNPRMFDKFGDLVYTSGIHELLKIHKLAPLF